MIGGIKEGLQILWSVELDLIEQAIFIECYQMKIDGEEQIVKKKKGTWKQKLSDEKYEDVYLVFICFDCMYIRLHPPVPKSCVTFDKYMYLGMNSAPFTTYRKYRKGSPLDSS